MASTETLPLQFDCSPLLANGETPSAPSCVLLDLNTGHTYAAGIAASPSVSTVYVTQTVTGLVAGHSYRLLVTFTAAAGKVWTMMLSIYCKA